MFKAGEYIIYGGEGVCLIRGIVRQNFGGREADYYELIPKFKNYTEVFVPCDNERLTSRMMPLMTVGEVEELIKAIPRVETMWIENEPQRKETYRQMLLSQDRRNLVCILKTLYMHKQKCIEQGRKLHVCDEKMYAEAASKLHCEIATVMDISPNEAEKYIEKRVQEGI